MGNTNLSPLCRYTRLRLLRSPQRYTLYTEYIDSISCFEGGTIKLMDCHSDLLSDQQFVVQFSFFYFFVFLFIFDDDLHLLYDRVLSVVLIELKASRAYFTFRM